MPYVSRLSPNPGIHAHTIERGPTTPYAVYREHTPLPPREHSKGVGPGSREERGSILQSCRFLKFSRPRLSAQMFYVCPVDVVGEICYSELMSCCVSQSRSWQARLKGLLARLPLGFGIIEFCHKCGVRQPLLWTADDDLWQRVVGGPAGVLCPPCFDEKAKMLGIMLRWKPEIDDS